MRSLVLGLILVGCGHRESERPRAPLTSSPCPTPAVITAAPDQKFTALYENGKFVAAARIEDHVDRALEKRALDATFHKYLTTECPDIPAMNRVHTWIAADELKAEVEKKGLLVPRVVQRIDGHFTATDVLETMLTIDPGVCVANGAHDLLYVVFASADERAAPKLRLRVATSDWGVWRIVGVVERDGLDTVFVAPSSEVTLEGYALSAGAPLGSLTVLPLRFAFDGSSEWTAERESTQNSYFDRTCRLVVTAPPAPFALQKLGCEK